MPSEMLSGGGARRAGFTLIEAVVSLVIVGVVLLAALNTVGSVARSRASQVDHRAGQMLAQSLMSEILQGYYQEPDGPPVFGREAGESNWTRAAWDDVDDYDTWSKQPPHTKEDVPLDQFAGWTRSVSVVEVNPLTLNDAASSSSRLRKITVTVTSPSGNSTEITALRADLAALEQAPTLDSAYVSQIEIDLQLDPDPVTRVRTGVSVLNHRPPQGPEEG